MLHLIGPARTKQAVILADQRVSAAEAYEWGLVEEVADPGKAFDAAMALAIKVAAQPPLSVAMTKLTVNRLAHALDDLASHVDVDQSRWQASARITRRASRRSSAGASRGSGGGEGSTISTLLSADRPNAGFGRFAAHTTTRRSINPEKPGPSSAGFLSLPVSKLARDRLVVFN